MRLTHLSLSVLLATLFLALAPRAADGASGLVPDSRGTAGASARVAFQAILVIASDEGTTDSRLSAHEATLKRVLRFKSYQRVGDAATTLAEGGEATVAIGRGFNLDIWVTDVSDREVVFGVRWYKGKLTLANTKVTRPRRSTTVIGGPVVEDGKGTYAVMVTTN